MASDGYMSKDPAFKNEDAVRQTRRQREDETLNRLAVETAPCVAGSHGTAKLKADPRGQFPVRVLLPHRRNA